jgi:hypothetical protein
MENQDKIPIEAEPDDWILQQHLPTLSKFAQKKYKADERGLIRLTVSATG